MRACDAVRGRFGSRLSPCFLCLGTVANHVLLAILIEAIQFLWMDFAVLCVLLAISASSVGMRSRILRTRSWHSGRIWSEFNVKRGGHGLRREVSRSGDRCSGFLENTELVKIISTVANTKHVDHFEMIIYLFSLFLLAVSFIFVCSSWRVLYNIEGVLKTLGVCVCYWWCQFRSPCMLCWLSSMIFLEWTCCAPTRRARSHRTSLRSSRSFRGVRLQSKCCCPLHCWLLCGPRTQRMSLTRCCLSPSRKCRLIWAVTRLIYPLFDSAVKTTESICFGLLSQSCGDQGRCGCASVVAC